MSNCSDGYYRRGRITAGDPVGVVLCADDFGISPAVSKAILTLLYEGRISATGCMVVSSFWCRHAAWLQPLQGRADLGLHLTLTDQRPLGPMPRLAPDGRLPGLGRLMALAFTGRLPAEEISAEITRQLDAFEAGLGAPPDFVDGHHHIQQLPVIGACLLAVLRRRFAGALPYVRVCGDRWPAILGRRIAVTKTAFLAGLATPFRRAAATAGVPANDGFRGIHDFSGATPIRTLFQRFLARPWGRTLINCHPGEVDDELRAADRLLEPRAWEFAYLQGPDFAADLDTAGVVPTRFAAAG